MAFKYKFFSLAGQKERLQNVGKVLNISFNPFAKGKVEANIKNKTLKNVAEFVANNPYTSAGLVAGGVTAARSLASGSGSVLKGAVQVVKKNPFKAAAGTVVGGAAVTSQKVQDVVFNVASKVTPEGLIGQGARIGEFIESPSKEAGKDLLKDIGLTGAIVGGGLAVATGVIPAVAGLFDGGKEGDLTQTPTGAIGGDNPIASTTPITATTTKVKETKKQGVRRYTKRKKVKDTPTIVNNIRIDDRDIYSSNRKVFKRKDTK